MPCKESIHRADREENPGIDCLRLCNGGYSIPAKLHPIRVKKDDGTSVFPVSPVAESLKVVIRIRGPDKNVGRLVWKIFT